MSGLDRIDRTLLRALQNNARISNKELAAQIGLAPSSCLARVRKLEADGVIRGYRAELSPRDLGLDLQAMISVELRLHVDQAFCSLGDHLRALPETVAVYCLAGSIDFLVHVACRDSEHLRVLTLRGFINRPEVSRIETSLVFGFTRSDLAIEDGTSAAASSADRAPPRRRGSRSPVVASRARRRS